MATPLRSPKLGPYADETEQEAATAAEALGIVTGARPAERAILLDALAEAEHRADEIRMALDIIEPHRNWMKGRSAPNKDRHANSNSAHLRRHIMSLMREKKSLTANQIFEILQERFEKLVPYKGIVRHAISQLRMRGHLWVSGPYIGRTYHLAEKELGNEPGCTCYLTDDETDWPCVVHPDGEEETE